MAIDNPPARSAMCDGCARRVVQTAAVDLVSVLERLIQSAAGPVTLQVTPGAHARGSTILTVAPGLAPVPDPVMSLTATAPSPPVATPAVSTRESSFSRTGKRQHDSRHARCLTTRQRQILALAADGLTNDQIARRLTISISTVERHCTMAYRSLGVRNRAEALTMLVAPAGGLERPVPRRASVV